MDHASPFRKRTFDAADIVFGLAFVRCPELAMAIVIFFPDFRTEGSCVSSHCVSQIWAAKSSLETIPRSASRLVLMPSIYVSAKARFAFMTTSSQVGAVIMILAIKLSKYVPMTAG